MNIKEFVDEVEAAVRTLTDPLKGQARALEKENHILANDNAQYCMMLQAISFLVEGEEPSDFAMSFPLVRQVADAIQFKKRRGLPTQELREGRPPAFMGSEEG